MKNWKLRVSALLFTAILAVGYFTPSAASVANAKTTSVDAVKPRAAVTATSNVGTLKGDFQVTPTGQAHYTIPIDVPPGTAKMQPALSIAYDSTSSNTHNGPLGMGFSIEGLTAITRCNSNKTLNGLIHGVDFSDQDRFCLNGEQLVAVKGAYGADGTEYRTYIDSKAKIVSSGRVGNGPANFKVWTKGGQVATYGVTPDSQIYAQGKPTIATWALTQITDTAGNYLTVRYLKDDPNGAFYPASVNYTGNAAAGIAPYYSVVFSYEARPDKVESYTAGSVVRINQRLKNIQVKNINPEKVISSYNFTYEISPNSYRSRITSIQKISSDGVALPPTQFTWQTNEEGWVKSQNYAYVPDRPIDGGEFVSLTGTGTPEFVQRYAQMVEGKWSQQETAWVNTKLNTGWALNENYFPPYEMKHYDDGDILYGTDTGARFVDLRGTGLDDFVIRGNLGKVGYWVGAFINTGSGWQNAPQFIPPDEFSTLGRDEGSRFIHLTGSGRADFVQNVIGDNGVQAIDTWINDGTTWTRAQPTLNPPFVIADLLYPKENGTDTGVRFLDLRGTGLDDVIQACNGSGGIFSDAYLNTGNGWVHAPQYAPGGIFTYYGLDEGARFIHLTTSGLPDFVLSGSSGKGSWINNGNGWTNANDNYLLPTSIASIICVDGHCRANDDGTQFADLRGTGLDDLVNHNLLFSVAYINNGSKWIKDDNYKVPVFTDRGFKFIDTTGSGLPDIVKFGVLLRSAWFNKAQKYPDYLISITDGIGSKLNIDYEALSIKSDPQNPIDVYTKEHDAKYPNMDWQGPMYVVDKTTSSANINDPKAIARVLANSPNSKNALDHITTYHYTGAKFNHLGLGFLGFHKITSTDQTTGLATTTTYSQDINAHNQGSPVGTEIRLSDAAQTLISSSQNVWDLKTYGDGKPNTTYYSPYVKQSSKNSYTLTGKPISTETTDNTLDDFGNPTKIVSTTKDFVNNETYTTTTENTYNNDTSKWFLGELTYAKVTKSGTNRTSQTRTSRFEYYPANSLLKKSIAEPDNPDYTLTTDYERDNFGNVITTTVSGPGITNRVTQAKYDPTGRFVLQITNPLKQITTQMYDQITGLLTCSVDLNSLETYYTYDGFGRLVKKYIPGDPLPIPTDISFNWVDLSKIPAGVIHDALQNVSYSISTHTQDSTTQTEYYDRLGRKVATTTQSFDNKTTWQLFYYDELDRLTAQTLPFFEGAPVYKTQIQYDVLGRVTQTTLPDNSTTQINYDGFKTTTVNQLKQQLVKQTNALGQLVKTVDNLGSATTYQYDAYGNMTAMIDSANHRSEIIYDFLGRKTEIKDPDKGHWYYSYDVLGQLISQTDALGHKTTFKYDPLGRMIFRQDPAGPSSWEYDTAIHGVGKIAIINGVAGVNGQNPDITAIHKARQSGLESYSKIFAYDKLSRPSKTTTVLNGVSYFSSQDYDADSRVNTQTYPNNVIVQNSYNALGFLVKISDFNTKKDYWTLKATDAAGHVTWETHSNGLNTAYTYDPKTNFLTAIDSTLGLGLTLQKHFFPGTTGLTAKHEEVKAALSGKHVKNNSFKINELQNKSIIQSEKYAYDAIGNVQTHQDSVNAVNDSYTYDGLNRITAATGSTNETFQYDALGNITYKSDVGTYKYGENGSGPHAVTSITGVKPSTFQYDANGDQTGGTIAGVNRRITYSSFSKPLSIITPTQTVNFYYNADRESFERVDQTSTKTVTTYYLGDYEIDSINDGKTVTMEQKCYIGPSTIYDIKKVTGQPDVTNIYTTLHNNIGSLTDTTDASGNILQHFSYTPFGEQKQTKGQILDNPITHHGFTGHEEIEGTNLIHMNGRIYDPVIGRFLSADPFVQAPDNSQSLNRYSYCLNNPLALTDPSGFGWLSKMWHKVKDSAFVRIAIGVVVGLTVTAICIATGGLAAYGAAFCWGALAGGVTTFGLGLASGKGFGQSLGEGVAAAGIVYTLGAGLKAVKGLNEPPNLPNNDNQGSAPQEPQGHSDGGASAQEGSSFADHTLAAAAITVDTSNIAALNFDANGWLTDRLDNGFVVGSTAASYVGNYSNGAKTGAYKEILGDSQQYIHENNQQAKSSLAMVAYNYVVEHGSFSADLSVPIGPYINVEIGGSATAQGYSFHLGVGPAYGAAFDFSKSVTLSYGQEPYGFTQTVYAEKGFYKEFGVGGSIYHSSTGFGAEIKTGYVTGFVAGADLGYTTRRFNW